MSAADGTSVALLRWGLIGLGRHATTYIAPAIRGGERGRLVAGADLEVSRRQAFSEEDPQFRGYATVEELLADPDVDAVYVVSPNFLHREHTVAAARAGKHVLCEKPFALTEEDARTMVNACAGQGVALGVGFNQRHNPVHVAARDAIRDGAIGEVDYASATYMHVLRDVETSVIEPTWHDNPAWRGGGSYMGTGVHAADILRFVLSQELVQVAATADKRWQATGQEQHIQVSFQLSRGGVATLAAGLARYPYNDLVVYGSKGTLRCNGSLGNLGGGSLELLTGTKSTRAFRVSDTYRGQVDAYAASVAEGKPPNASGQDGLRAVQVALAVYTSLREGAAQLLPAAEQTAGAC